MKAPESIQLDKFVLLYTLIGNKPHTALDIRVVDRIWRDKDMGRYKWQKKRMYVFKKQHYFQVEERDAFVWPMTLINWGVRHGLVNKYPITNPPDGILIGRTEQNCKYYYQIKQ